MTEPLQSDRPSLWLIVSIAGLALITLCVAYVHFFSKNASKKSPTVAIPVISACNELAPGMKRIGAKAEDRYMLQFDVPLSEVRMREGITDAPPLEYGFDIRPHGSESILEISYGPLRNNIVVDRARTSSSHVEKRTILNDRGQTVGNDDWGYLNTGKRWRQTRFQGWVTAEYSFVEEKDAKLFDQIILSACLLPTPGTQSNPPGR